MWHLDKLGRGRWADQNGNWSFDLHGGATGLSIGNRVNLRPVDNDTLPVAEEQYIRGDRWHVNFPQGDESFALRLGLEVVDSRPGCCVIECCIAIQTDRLRGGFSGRIEHQRPRSGGRRGRLRGDLAGHIAGDPARRGCTR